MPLLEELNYAPKHPLRLLVRRCSSSAARSGNATGSTTRPASRPSSPRHAGWKTRKRWLIETDRGDRMTATYFVLACGRQSLPKLPGIAGIDTFEGHAFHSSRWDYGYTGGDQTGELTEPAATSAWPVVGTGATAVQIVPEVAQVGREALCVPAHAVGRLHARPAGDPARLRGQCRRRAGRRPGGRISRRSCLATPPGRRSRRRRLDRASAGSLKPMMTSQGSGAVARRASRPPTSGSTSRRSADYRVDERDPRRASRRPCRTRRRPRR